MSGMDRQNQNEERVEINMRPVKDAHLPIGVMITKDGLLKQPTKKESEQLELQKKNTPVKKNSSENLLNQIEQAKQAQAQAKQPQAQAQAQQPQQPQQAQAEQAQQPQQAGTQVVPLDLRSI